MIDYYLLTKPGIIFGNLLTVAAGFLLASKANIDFGLFLATLLGLTLIMASACVFNNYIDRHMDRKMERTKMRAMVVKKIAVPNAMVFGTSLGVLGGAVLWYYTNNLALFVAAFGFFVYVFLYSFWKGKTIYGTAIGSVAGAVPPVVGYCAVSRTFDAGAIILFAMMVLWQMPHFFSIAMLHYKDYTAAEVPVLPIIKGAFVTKIHMVVYILGFIAVSAMLTVFGYTGIAYLAISLSMGFGWLLLCLDGFRSRNDQLWGKRMFHFSLVLVTALCIAIPLDKV